jgi:murein DD-endopeptidase MepM/ murein hydrolase activator NlpD
MTVERTKNIYNLPFPIETEVSRILYKAVSHIGPYKGAVDFSVPLGTTILAPLDGVVIDVVDGNEKYGVRK